LTATEKDIARWWKRGRGVHYLPSEKARIRTTSWDKEEAEGIENTG